MRARSSRNVPVSRWRPARRRAVGMQAHSVQFTVKFPRVEQTFQGWLFTGDGKVLTGSSRMLDREAGFYAVRLEDR